MQANLVFWKDVLNQTDSKHCVAVMTYLNSVPHTLCLTRYFSCPQAQIDLFGPRQRPVIEVAQLILVHHEYKMCCITALSPIYCPVLQTEVLCKLVTWSSAVKSYLPRSTQITVHRQGWMKVECVLYSCTYHSTSWMHATGRRRDHHMG